MEKRDDFTQLHLLVVIIPPATEWSSLISSTNRYVMQYYELQSVIVHRITIYSIIFSTRQLTIPQLN